MYDCVKETKHMKSCYQFNLPLIFQFLITTKEIEKLGNFKSHVYKNTSRTKLKFARVFSGINYLESYVSQISKTYPTS